jgi:hypothetical protein
MGSHRPPNNWRQLAGPPPLTPEYQKVFDASLSDQRAGRPGNWPSTFCLPEGMPAMVNLYNPMASRLSACVTSGFCTNGTCEAKN